MCARTASASRRASCCGTSFVIFRKFPRLSAHFAHTVETSPATFHKLPQSCANSRRAVRCALHGCGSLCSGAHGAQLQRTGCSNVRPREVIQQRQSRLRMQCEQGNAAHDHSQSSFGDCCDLVGLGSEWGEKLEASNKCRVRLTKTEFDQGQIQQCIWHSDSYNRRRRKVPQMPPLKTAKIQVLMFGRGVKSAATS